jgi:drug/metabolite transporter (DMT)-like permease
VLLISMLFLGERLTLLQGLGGLAILSGILILAVTEPRDMANAEETSRKQP